MRGQNRIIALNDLLWIIILLLQTYILYNLNTTKNFKIKLFFGPFLSYIIHFYFRAFKKKKLFNDIKKQTNEHIYI